MERRTFLQSGTMAAVASAIPCSPLGLPFSLSAREPIVRSGAARLRLALAAYSFRRNFAYMKGKDQKPAAGNEPMDMYKFVDFCGEHGCLGAELTSYFFPTNAKRKYFLDLKRHAFERGVEICGTAIGNNFSIGAGEELDKQIEAANVWINNAAILGAPHIRFFAGTAAHFARAERNISDAIDAMQICADHATKRGIVLGVENHGKISSEQLLTVIEGVNSQAVGINLDTGNFISDDPYADIERCLPYTVNVQVKIEMKRPDGSKYPADFDRIATLLKDAKYQGYVVLEYESEDPYKNVPVYLEKLQKAIA